MLKKTKYYAFSQLHHTSIDWQKQKETIQIIIDESFRGYFVMFVVFRGKKRRHSSGSSSCVSSGAVTYYVIETEKILSAAAVDC